MKILGINEIKNALQGKDLLPVMEAGFVAYSNGKAVVPPVGELLFDNPPGDVHIKYGYIAGDSYYVIKIASGFYHNPALGLPSGNGMMLLFEQKTGVPLCLLLDEGYLTDLRTAIAGAIAARHLAPTRVHRIGIVGTGVQARFQLLHLKSVTSCREVLAWGRHKSRLERYRDEMSIEGFKVETASGIREITETCNLIVTTTAATAPLIRQTDLRSGTHITAMGSDTPAKQELDPHILSHSNLVVADSIPQCLLRGEISHAAKAGLLKEEDVVELGCVIAGRSPGRTDDSQITVADLTGVAVQDIQIAKLVYEAGSS